MRPSKRDELVRKALEVFYKHGFTACGMDFLVSETGISKTSMYKHFRTKEDLILAALRLRDELFRNNLFRRVDELAAQPGDKLLAIFDVLAEWFEEEGFQGCMFIKAAAEFQQTGHPIYALSREHKRIILTYMIELAQAAGAKKPQAVAEQILLLQEGAIVAAHMGISDAPAADAKVAAACLLKEAGV